MKAILFTYLFLVGSAWQLAVAQEIPNRGAVDSGNIVVETPSLHSTPHLTTIREDISVFKNTAGDKYFTVPILLPNWKHFAHELKNLESKNVDEESIHNVNLNISFWPKEVEDELVEKINEVKSFGSNSSKTASEANLSVLPYAFYVIKADMGDGLKPIYSSVDLSMLVKENISLVNENTIAKRIEIGLSGTRSQLRYLYNNRTKNRVLTGQLYSPGHSVSTSVASIKINEFLQSDHVSKLFGDEAHEFSNTVETKNASDGWSVNLGFVTVGDSDQESETTATIKNLRVVSRDFINKLISRQGSFFQIDQTGTEAQIASQSELISKMLTSMLKKTSLEFEHNESHGWRMKHRLYGYVENPRKETIENVLSANPNVSIKGGNSASFAIAGVPVSANSNSEFTNSNNIQWQRKGDSWVPSKVELYIADLTELKKKIEIKWSRNIVRSERKTYRHSFLHPASVSKIEQNDVIQLTDSMRKIAKRVQRLESRKMIATGVYESDGRGGGKLLFSDGIEKATIDGAKDSPQLRLFFDRGIEGSYNVLASSNIGQTAVSNTGKFEFYIHPISHENPKGMNLRTYKTLVHFTVFAAPLPDQK